MLTNVLLILSILALFLPALLSLLLIYGLLYVAFDSLAEWMRRLYHNRKGEKRAL